MTLNPDFPPPGIKHTPSVLRVRPRARGAPAVGAADADGGASEATRPLAETPSPQPGKTGSAGYFHLGAPATAGNGARSCQVSRRLPNPADLRNHRLVLGSADDRARLAAAAGDAPALGEPRWREGLQLTGVKR